MCALTHDTKLHSRNIVQAAHESFYSLTQWFWGENFPVSRNRGKLLHGVALPFSAFTPCDCWPSSSPFKSNTCIYKDQFIKTSLPFASSTGVSDLGCRFTISTSTGERKTNKSREFQKNVRGPSSLERQGPQKHNVWFHSITLFLPDCEKEKKWKLLWFL